MQLRESDIGKGTELVIFRKRSSAKQTLGRFLVFNADDRCNFSGSTLELPNNSNQSNISRVPSGVYKCTKRIHKRFGRCIEIHEVSRRTGIFIHVGNYYTQIRGCILVGSGFKHINSDGVNDIYHSLPTMSILWDSLKKDFDLVIFNDPY